MTNNPDPLVERLRALANDYRLLNKYLVLEAADAIEQKDAEMERFHSLLVEVVGEEVAVRYREALAKLANQRHLDPRRG